MNPWLALAIFFMSIADDVAVVVYLRRVVAGKRRSASLLSGALTILISLEVFIYVSAWQYIFFNAIGSVVGTWIAIWLEERLPKQIQRNTKGRFRQPIPPPVKILKSEKERMA
jgi:hypothetical protein